MSQENVETVRSIYEAFGKLLAAIHPEVTCHDRLGHPLATVFHGHAGLMDLIADDLRNMDEVAWEPLEFTEVGPHVIVRVRQTGRGRVSRAPVEGEVVMVWAVDSGKARELHIYSTEAEALEAVGLSE
jgi:ketosteroid isomerase-like protein